MKEEIDWLKQEGFYETYILYILIKRSFWIEAIVSDYFEFYLLKQIERIAYGIPSLKRSFKQIV